MARKKSQKPIKKKPREMDVVPPFWSTLSNFLAQHDASLKSVALSTQVLKLLLEVEQKKMDAFIKAKGKNVKTIGNRTTFNVAPQDDKESDKLKYERNKTLVALDLIPKSLFVSLISNFDTFIAGLIKAILEIEPRIISPEKTLSFQEIKDFKTIKDAFNYLIDKEIDGLLRKSHSSHIEWMGARGLDVQKFFSEELPFFVELTERRNLYTHNNGVVNDQYLMACKEARYTIPKECKKGAQLPMTPQYFFQSADCLYRVSAKLTFLLWKKFIPKEIEAADRYFNNEIGVALIIKNKLSLAEEMLRFAVFNGWECTEEFQRLYTINLALALKLASKKSESLEILKSLEWTTQNNELKLAVALIKDDFEEAFKLMERVGRNSDILNKRSYYNDPIFASVRPKKQFAKVFEKVFKEKFVIPQEIENRKVEVSTKKNND